MKPICRIILGGFALCVFQLTATAAVDSASSDRLMQLCKLWGQIKYFHPYLAYKDIQWDDAVIRTIPAVRASHTDDEYISALNGMLAELQDPATVVRFRALGAFGAQASSNRKELVETWKQTNLLGLRFNLGKNFIATLTDELAKHKAEIAEAAKLVIDLRTLSREESRRVASAIESLFPLIVSHEVTLPEMRYLHRIGYVSQRDGPSQAFFVSFMTDIKNKILPVGTSGAKRLAFVVDKYSLIPPTAIAMIKAGEAVVVAEGSVSDEVLGVSKVFTVGPRLEAAVRTHEMTDGWTFKPDVVLAPAQGAGWAGPAFQAAVKLVGDEAFRSNNIARVKKPMPAATWMPERKYSEMLLPPLEYRLLALFRFWNAIIRSVLSNCA